jgi:CRISPR-associated protein Cmr2
MKRVSARGEGFPSITRIALQPWVRRLAAPVKQQLATQLEALKADGIDLCRGYRVGRQFALTDATGAVSAVPNPYIDFNFDCEILLPSRRRLVPAELLAGNKSADDAVKAIGALLKDDAAIAEDGLYVCALVADGDRMGEILQDESLTLEEHQALSAALARFADNCHAIAARHDGACIYAGGDDVQALCPVDTALALARELAEAFAATLGATMPAGLRERLPPSLSVGLGFGHVMHPLADLRALATQAKDLAKQGSDERGLRNALGVIVAPRSGAPVQVVGQWSETLGADESATVLGLDGRLAVWRDAFTTGQLSRSAGYDLARLARATGVRALRAEAARLFGRRLNESESDLLQAQLMPPIDAPSSTAACEKLAAEWYVGRWLSLHTVGGSAESTETPASEHQA